MTTPATTVGELVARRDRGVDWLDQHYPGWPALIDLNTLDIDDSLSCILGQVLGDFWDAPLTWGEAVGMGFQARNGRSFDGDVEALDRLWRDVIEQRQAEAADELLDVRPPLHPAGPAL